MKVLADYIFPEKVKTLEWLANNIYQTFKKAFSCCLCDFSNLLYLIKTYMLLAIKFLFKTSLRSANICLRLATKLCFKTLCFRKLFSEASLEEYF